VCFRRVMISCLTSGTRHVTFDHSCKSKRTGLWLLQTEHSSGHLWHKYLITINQSSWRPWNVWSDDFKTTRSPWFSRFLVSSIPLSGNHDRNNKLWNIVSIKRCILNMQVLLEYCYIIHVNDSLIYCV
jgi:hypothetical protein